MSDSRHLLEAKRARVRRIRALFRIALFVTPLRVIAVFLSAQVTTDALVSAVVEFCLIAGMMWYGYRAMTKIERTLDAELGGEADTAPEPASRD